ncbi:hypothetical protein [Hyphomonas sp.]|uniref:hypothetical protein n=1 Tax=Hyphomonas sp. TaxID=87 RepID=UPI003D2DCBFB
MRPLAFALLLAILTSLPAFGQVCEPTAESHAVRIVGQDRQGASVADFPEVAGDRSFYQTLGNGWVFALMRVENGWSIRLYEKEPVGSAVDLTSLTPPLRGAANPRDILGWHFRNKANTAPNTGDVNAPQELRAFVISPGLQGTAGLRASDGVQMPGPEDGIGWLKVIDFGLANPVTGTPASMNWLKFDACLSWPRTDDEAAHLVDRASLDFVDEEKEAFGSCGLDLETYDLSARFLPRTLGGDLDSDGVLDEAAQVRRISDDQRGIAICRSGTRLEVLGFESSPRGDVRTGYAGQAEAWQWISPGGSVPLHITGYDLPEADGDMLVLERIEKEAVLVYWQYGQMKMERLYHHVEP